MLPFVSRQWIDTFVDKIDTSVAAIRRAHKIAISIDVDRHSCEQSRALSHREEFHDALGLELCSLADVRSIPEFNRVLISLLN